MPDVMKTVGRYEILREVGRGGMAMVYLARQTDLDRFVALKELGAFHASDPSFAQRFLRESRVAGSLSHPNICTVHDYFEHDGTPYIAMEYIERGSLRPYVGTMNLAQIGGVLEGLLAGLAHGEQHGIVHRDLKPENLMVTSDGRVKIADFGIAKATNQMQTGAFLTATGTTVGTPTYMAPEQAMAQDIGPPTDLYSVGCMAFEMFTGRVPFHDTEAPMAILLRHVNEQIPAVEVDRPQDRPGHLGLDRAHARQGPDEAHAERQRRVGRVRGDHHRAARPALAPRGAPARGLRPVRHAGAADPGPVQGHDRPTPRCPTSSSPSRGATPSRPSAPPGPDTPPPSDSAPLPPEPTVGPPTPAPGPAVGGDGAAQPDSDGAGFVTFGAPAAPEAAEVAAGRAARRPRPRRPRSDEPPPPDAERAEPQEDEALRDLHRARAAAPADRRRAARGARDPGARAGARARRRARADPEPAATAPARPGAAAASGPPAPAPAPLRPRSTRTTTSRRRSCPSSVKPPAPVAEPSRAARGREARRAGARTSRRRSRAARACSSASASPSVLAAVVGFVVGGSGGTRTAAAARRPPRPSNADVEALFPTGWTKAERTADPRHDARLADGDGAAGAKGGQSVVVGQVKQGANNPTLLPVGFLAALGLDAGEVPPREAVQLDALEAAGLPLQEPAPERARQARSRSSPCRPPRASPRSRASTRARTARRSRTRSSSRPGRRSRSGRARSTRPRLGKTLGGLDKKVSLRARRAPEREDAEGAGGGGGRARGGVRGRRRRRSRALEVSPADADDQRGSSRRSSS